VNLRKQSILSNWFIQPDLSSSTTFPEFYTRLLLERIKLISYILILTYPLFLIVDVVFLPEAPSLIFKQTLILIHFASFVISATFVVIYEQSEKGPKSLKQRYLLIYIYLLLYLLLGATASVNSQLFSGNIVAYLIVLFGVAVLLPIRPAHLALMLSSVHLLFIIGLFSVQSLSVTSILTLVNATGVSVIAFTTGLLFYKYREKEFENQAKLKQNEENFKRLFEINPLPLILLSLDRNELILMNKQELPERVGELLKSGAKLPERTEKLPESEPNLTEKPGVAGKSRRVAEKRR